MMKLFLFTFLFALVALIVAADQGRLPPLVTRMYAFPGGDKVGHFFLIGFLAFLVNMSLPLRPADKPWRSLWFGSLVVAAAVSIEEASQAFFPSRSLSWVDLGSSYAGILCFGYGAWVLRSHRRRRES